MHVIADNVRELSTSTGTGNFTTAGATGPLPTMVTGRSFDSVLASGDTFDYVIHHKTLNEWEVGKGTYQGTNEFVRTYPISSSNSNSLVDFSAGDKVVWIGPTSWITRQGFDITNIQMFNAVNGSDNSTAITAARTVAGADKPLMAPYGEEDWGLITTLGNLGIDASGQGTAFSFVQGTNSSPSEVSNPVIRIEKYTDGGDSNGQADHGGIDVRVKKVDGVSSSNNVYSSYFYTEHDSDGTAGGVLYAVKGTSADIERLYGFNAYLEKTVTIPNGIVKGAYFNMTDSSGQDAGWQSTYADGSLIGIELTVNQGRAQFGYLTQASGVAGTGFYTGLLFATNSILPYSFDNNAEAIRIQGGSASETAYQGIWFQNGYLRHALNLVGPTYENNSMMLLPKDNRITFGTGPSDATYLTWTSSDALNVVGGTIAINGTQVVGSRATGWTAASGTASRATFDPSSVTTEQLGQRVKALIDDLISHGLIGA